MSRPRFDAGVKAVVAVYVLTLALFFVASFWPDARVWGVAGWGYFPVITRLVFLALGLAVAAGAVLYTRRACGARIDSSDNRADQANRLWYLGIPVAWGVLCYLLKAETHFLGDGYQQLASLASDQPLIRARSFGAVALNVWVKNLFGTGDQAALLTYRTVSIAAGVLFAAATLYTAHRLFDSLRARLLFALGMLTGGYALLFFGYAENYAFFCLAVAMFTYAGLLIAEGRLRRVWILPAIGLAVFFHVLGLVLLPAAFYILVRKTWLARRFVRLKAPVRGAIFIVVAVKAILLFAYLYGTNYYFRFAFVPLFPGRLVLEGYTLLSLKHLADWANLILCLAPALPVFVVFVVRMGWRRLWQEPALRVLLTVIGGALAATFLLDPKLGMPRDWDLFAFAGVPIAVLCFYWTSRDAGTSRLATVTATLGIALGLWALLPRVVVQHTPLLAVARMQDYAHLDLRKNRTGIYTLGQYLLSEGYVSEYREVRAFRDSVYVEDRLSAQAGELVRLQRYDELRGLAAQLIAVNPQQFSGWMYLGRAYNTEGRYDSAQVALSIADGLNPGSPGVLNELGLACYHGGDKKRAENVWLKSLAIDRGQFPPHYSLARIYREWGDNARYIEHLRAAATHDEAPAQVSLELADYYLGRREFEPAKAAIYRALALNADSAAVRALRNKYPGLIDWKE